MENPTDMIAALRGSLDGCRMLLSEANDRVLNMRGEAAVLDAKNKAFQAELEAIKAEKAAATEPPASE